MKRLTILLIFLFYPVSFLLADSADVISNFAVRGNRTVEESVILAQIQSKSGSILSRDEVNEDIKRIFRTGYFDNVKSRIEAAGGKRTLVFEVVEKPAIKNVFLEGNKEVSDDTLKDKLNLTNRRFLDWNKLKSSIEQAKSYYQGLGYSDAEITYAQKKVGDNEVDLTFKISEGERKVIREVVFEGVKQLEVDDVEDVIKTSERNRWISWITGSGILKKEQLEADTKEITRLYLNNGYVDIVVNEPVVEPIENGLRITFKVSEGEQYSYGEISARGTLLDGDAQKTIDGIEAKSGQIFNADTLRKDTFTISEKFTDKGFAFANVKPDTEINRDQKLVNIKFDVDKGKEITIHRINISGDDKTEEHVIRRALQIHEQELFSSSKIKKSQEVLQRLGYFEEVTITPEPSDREDNVDLNVSVREGNTGSFSVGGGLSSGDGFLLSTQISENNLFGTGNSLSLDVNAGARRENYVLSFNNPRVWDSYLSMGVDLLSTKRIFDDFDRGQRGGSYTVGYPLWFLGPEFLEDIRGSVTYELLDINISNIRDTAPQVTQDQAGQSTSSSITPRIVRNTINNPLDPTNGSRQIAGVELAGLGGDQQFWLLQLSNTYYTEFLDTSIGNFIFSQRTRFDYGDTFNNERFPLFRRFFPGGINSVRGYRDRQVGPKDVNGQEYGGSKELIANFEMLFPISTSIGLRGLLFYDAGNAFDDQETIQIGNLRQAIGFGVRWRSPIAPIRIEIGYPLDKEQGDKSIVPNFTFGAPL
jgi:outer membrane protein insertion porin family